MVKIAILILLILHGLIHFLGFVKAFELVQVEQLKEQISKLTGIFWLLAALLFLVAAVLLYLSNQSWWMVAGAAVIISQLLIILSWSDAKAGTIANIIITIPIIMAIAEQLPDN